MSYHSEEGDVPGAEAGLTSVHLCLTPIRRMILRGASAVVANSAGLRNMSQESDPIPVHVIPNGVDTVFFAPKATIEPGSAPFRLLFVGRLQAQKNLLWLLEQLSSLGREPSLSFTLDIVGDGPLRPLLASHANKLSLGDVVKFHGWKDKASIRAYYQAAHLLINPSIYEGMPNVVLEAMACGRPILASRVPGNDAVVSDHVTGRLFSLGDSADFSACFDELLSRPDLARKFGIAGRERAVQEFSWARAAKSYLELLPAFSPISQLA